MMKAIVVFGVGYVLGSKAGRERYEQIRTVAQKAATELDKRGQGNTQRRRVGDSHSG